MRFINLVIILHVLVWLFVMFGGIISEKICKLNLFIFIPLIYMIQILPCHLFVSKKIIEINHNYDNYNEIEIDDGDFEFFMNDPSYMKNIKILNIPQDRIQKITKIYILEENKYILPMVQRRLRFYFTKSFGDPLSHQKILILGMIINVYALRYIYKRV